MALKDCGRTGNRSQSVTTLSTAIEILNAVRTAGLRSRLHFSTAAPDPNRWPGVYAGELLHPTIPRFEEGPSRREHLISDSNGPLLPSNLLSPQRIVKP